MLNISETKRFRDSCPTWNLWESAYGASIGDVSDDITWLYDVILVTSHYSKSSHSETRTRINYSCKSFKHTHTIVKHCVKKSAHSAINSVRRSIWRNPTIKWKLRIIGTVAVRWRRVGRLNLRSARVNSYTGLSVCSSVANRAYCMWGLHEIIVREYVFYVFLKIQKNATFYVFLKCHVKKRKKT